MSEIRKCKLCPQMIEFRRTKNGKMMPVNAEETTILDETGAVVRGHVPHHITCPQADAFRKAKNGEKTSG